MLQHGGKDGRQCAAVMMYRSDEGVSITKPRPSPTVITASVVGWLIVLVQVLGKLLEEMTFQNGPAVSGESNRQVTVTK
jgi:hypothetical protein